MKIGIHGLDARAVAMGRLLIHAGYDVCTSDVDTDASACDMLIFAGPRGGTDEILDQLGRLGSGAVVVDAMEGIPHIVQGFGSRRVVRVAMAVPRSGTSVFLSGDDPESVGLVREVFGRAGCVVLALDQPVPVPVLIPRRLKQTTIAVGLRRP
jgi:hypothetical protein